jgi:hypothetical protein
LRGGEDVAIARFWRLSVTARSPEDRSDCSITRRRDIFSIALRKLSAGRRRPSVVHPKGQSVCPGTGHPGWPAGSIRSVFWLFQLSIFSLSHTTPTGHAGCSAHARLSEQARRGGQRFAVWLRGGENDTSPLLVQWARYRNISNRANSFQLWRSHLMGCKRDTEYETYMLLTGKSFSSE